MTPDDALERELESLRPRPPSQDLRRRIGKRLDQPRRMRFAAGLATAAVAAGLSVAVVLRRPPAPPVEPPAGVEFVKLPSVLAYERAFAKSPADLDALLDREAVRTSRDVTPTRAGVGLNLLALQGS